MHSDGLWPTKGTFHSLIVETKFCCQLKEVVFLKNKMRKLEIVSNVSRLRICLIDFIRWIAN